MNLRLARAALAIIPTLSILPFALVSSMPWHAPYWASFALPTIALTAIYLWAQHRRDLLPAPIVLLIGLFVDFVTDGPLGYWAALYVLAYAIGSEHATAGLGRSVVVGRFVVVLTGLASIGWVIASAYYWRPFDVLPFAAGVLLGCVIYPTVRFLLDPLIQWLAVDDRQENYFRGTTFSATGVREASRDV